MKPASKQKTLEGIKQPPFETKSLRENLDAFFDMPIEDAHTGQQKKLGNFKWGVYAFYDYDGEPIYVGETNESLRTRIRRHLTNQRTDAVAMSVLDPFEVHKIVVWPLPQFDHVKGDKHPDRPRAVAYLKSLEQVIYRQAVKDSEFTAVLNEKIPNPKTAVPVDVPPSFERVVISDDVHALRSHPDIRLARRGVYYRQARSGHFRAESEDRPEKCTQSTGEPVAGACRATVRGAWRVENFGG